MHDLLEAQPRQARLQVDGVTIADIADEVDLERGAGKERGLHRGRVEARDRPDVRSQGANREDEVGRLQGARCGTRSSRATAGRARNQPAASWWGWSRGRWRQNSRSWARIATTGASRDFSRLLLSSAGRSRSFSSGARRSTMRRGLPLALVGPMRASSHASSSRVSGTSCGSQEPWQRGSMNSRRRSSGISRGSGALSRSRSTNQRRSLPSMNTSDLRQHAALEPEHARVVGLARAADVDRQVERDPAVASAPARGRPASPPRPRRG